MTEPLPFWRTMHQARRQAGLTQRELAARLGYSQSTVVRLESGLRLPTYQQCVRLMTVLGLTPAEVFGLAEEVTPEVLLKGVVDLRPLLDGCSPEGKKVAIRFLRELIAQIEASLLEPDAD